MSDIELRSEMTVELVDAMGDDLSVAQAAQAFTEHGRVSP